MPIGIYIHVPFCAKKCPYCDFFSQPFRKDAADAYTEAVIRNIRALLPAETQADTVYFGGGTPSLLPPDSLRRIMETVAAHSSLASDGEYTLEVNPLTVTPERLRSWRSLGINRLSVGVQSFQPEILAALGRTHTPEQAKSAILLAYEAGFQNISADLMLGLSIQTEEMLRRDLEIALSLPLTHISPYLLKIEEGTPFAENPPFLLDGDCLADRCLMLHDVLTAEGFLHYEISNFARPGFEGRHNTKYWRCQQYIGIGPGAHYAVGSQRRAVPRDLQAFCEKQIQPEEIIETDAGSVSERILLGLRLAEGIALQDYPCQSETLLKNAAPLIPRYLRHECGSLHMTPEGWLVSNAVLVRLLDGIS